MGLRYRLKKLKRLARKGSEKPWITNSRDGVIEEPVKFSDGKGNLFWVSRKGIVRL